MGLGNGVNLLVDALQAEQRLANLLVLQLVVSLGLRRGSCDFGGRDDGETAFFALSAEIVDLGLLSEEHWFC